jgi:D-glycero-alpha-D-manno-heptose 1-phosphate guanylyltransferase
VAVTSAIILAGGLGTRLRSAVPDVPKPLAPIAGRPFLEYQMDYWIAEGIRRFVLSVGYRHELIERHFGRRYRDADIDYAVEPEPLGTGGGLLLAAGRMASPGPWLLLNGDTFFEVRLEALEAVHRTADADITLSLYRVENNGRYMGVELDAHGRVSRLKAPPTGESQLINGGVYLLGASVLADLGCRPGERASLEDDLLGKAFAAGRRIWGCPVAGRFIDIGIPDDYRRAASVFTGGEERS